jgi:hypothetical protein
MIEDVDLRRSCYHDNRLGRSLIESLCKSMIHIAGERAHQPGVNHEDMTGIH